MHPSMSNQLDPVITTTERRSSKTSKGVRRSRSGMGVTWSKRIQIKNIPSLSQYSDEEKSNSFCGAEDYQRMRDETLEVSFLMKHGTKESDEVTYRGLESKREGDCRRRKLQRYRINLAVFQENDKQFDLGVHDPEAISDIYRLLTESTRTEALERAAQDAKDVGQQGAAPVSHPSSPVSPVPQGDSDSDSVNTMVEKNPMAKLTSRVDKMSRRNIDSSHLFAKPSDSLISSREGKRGLVVLASFLAQQE